MTPPVRVAAATAAVVDLAYLVLRPQTPDLPAQVARATAASRGAGLWWAGWYAGLDTPGYSLLTAHLMSLVGVTTVGLVATAAVCLGSADLLRDAVRPRAGAVAVSLVAGANLFSGRLTFASGMAVALGSLCCLRRGWRTAGWGLAALTGLVSPLAALCEVVALGALFLARPRRALVVPAVLCVAPVLVLSLLFTQPSSMPYGRLLLGQALLSCAGVLVAPVTRQVRLLAGLSALLAVAAYAVVSPVGSNAARMPMLLAAALVVATARRGVLTLLLAAALTWWPVVSLRSDLRIAAMPTATAPAYAGLLAHLPAAGTAVQRVEVVDPLTHGPSHFVAAQVPLARGWERQADAAGNHLFYGGVLTGETYRAWLVAHGVGWVALPTGRVDYAAVGERHVVLHGQPYLQQVWSDAVWRLFRVTVPAPVADGVLHATALTDTGVDLTADGAGSGRVLLRPSTLLTVRSATDPSLRGCVRPDGPDAVTVTVPSAGRWVVRAEPSRLLHRSC